MGLAYTEAYIKGQAPDNGLSQMFGGISATSEQTVYFKFERSSIVFGRRVQTWEITPTDASYNANGGLDLSKAQAEDAMQQSVDRAYSIAPLLESITLTAFFTAEDLPEKRNTFMDMVRGPYKFGWQGKLKLKLPNFDEVTVLPGAFELTTEREKRNIEYATGTFYVMPEAGSAAITGGKKETPKLAINYATAALYGYSSYVRAWDSTAATTEPTVIASDVSKLENTTTQFQKILAKIKGVENAITTPLANAAKTISSFTNDVNALISEPSKIFTNLFNSCSLIVSSIQGVGSQIESQYSIIAGVLTGFEGMISGTDTTDSAKSHAATIECATNAYALANIGDLYTQYTFPTQDDALEAISRFRYASDNLLAKLEYDGTPDISGQVRDLTGAVIKYLIDESANLPNVSTVLVSDQIPVIATCYDQYGDVSDAHVDDITTRNSIRNPNFPPRELSILKTL